MVSLVLENMITFHAKALQDNSLRFHSAREGKACLQDARGSWEPYTVYRSPTSRFGVRYPVQSKARTEPRQYRASTCATSSLRMMFPIRSLQSFFSQCFLRRFILFCLHCQFSCYTQILCKEKHVLYLPAPQAAMIAQLFLRPSKNAAPMDEFYLRMAKRTTLGKSWTRRTSSTATLI